MTNVKYNPEDPIAAIATPLSPGALAIVRASGKNCVQLVSKVFSRPKALLEAEGNTIVYGWIVEKENADKNGADNRIDEVLVSVFRAPKSFTGEEMCEISCHGGVSVVNAVYNLLIKTGFRPAERGEFTFRAYINGKADLTRAEAIREIIDSKTDASRSHAAGRLSGSLFEEIDGIKTLVTDTLAAIEVDIENPEDEETIADSFDQKDLVTARDRLQSLADSWKSEKIYQDGAKIVLAGKTNAGKSSLFNALLKEDRSIVSDIEGTTRDWIESWVSFDGIPARLFDTAGLRKTDDVIEARGVELTKDIAATADLMLYLVDSTKGVGTTFVVTLTLEDSDRMETPEEKESATTNKKILDGCRVLLAEDIAVNAMIMMKILNMRNIIVEHAENGRIAVEMFADSEEGYYDAILMDMRMPEMDGLEATEMIRNMDRRDSKKIPIIAVTANAFDEDVQNSLQAGLNAHLSKPVEPNEVYKILESLITE